MGVSDTNCQKYAGSIVPKGPKPGFGDFGAIDVVGIGKFCVEMADEAAEVGA